MEKKEVCKYRFTKNNSHNNGYSLTFTTIYNRLYKR